MTPGGRPERGVPPGVSLPTPIRSRDENCTDPTPVSRSRVWRLVPLGFMAAIVLLTYAAVVWTLPRGFDRTDEAFGYALIASDRIATDVPLGFQHLLHPLYVLTGQSVLAFRILRLLGYLLLSVALVACARAVTRRLGIRISLSGWAFILLLAQVGTFFAWSYPPRYPGYNELTSWFAQLGIAMIVLTLSWAGSAARRQGAYWVPWLIWAGLGAVTVLLVFAKVTSDMAFALFLLVALLIPSPELGWWKRWVSVVAGAFGTVVVLWLSGVPFATYVKHAFSLLFSESAQASFGHPVSVIVWVYWDSLLVTARDLLPVLVVFALTMAGFSRKVPVIRQQGSHGDAGSVAEAGTAGEVGGAGAGAMDRIAWIFGAVLIIALIALPKIRVWGYLGDLIFFIGAAAIIGLAIVGSHGARLRGSRASRAFVVAFAGVAIVAAPFISAVGTNNTLPGQFSFAATLWAVVLGIALVLLTQRATLLRSSARILPALIGCLLVIISAVAVKAEIEKPYRNEPLLSQETPTSVPELRGLLLTPADASLASWISAAGDALHADGIPATATSNPSDLFVFNHSGYATPWVGQGSQGPYKSLSDACRKKRPVDFFVLQRGSAMNTFAVTHVKSHLALCGIDFPADFTVVAKRDAAVRDNRVTIWRLKRNGASG